MIGYHVTTSKKLSRYEATGEILPPLHFWLFLESAQNWAARTGRSIILEIECQSAYPSLVYKPAGHAYWTAEQVRTWRRV